MRSECRDSETSCSWKCSRLKSRGGEDGKQGLLGVKRFGVVTLGVMLGQEKALSSCIPCGHLV